MKQKWDPQINLSAYQMVEAPSNYKSVEELQRYRSLLVEKSQPAANCILRATDGMGSLRVLEICSGSGRLLYTLDEKGILAAAVGVEVSPSRFQFAEAWKQELGAGHVKNVNCAASEYSFDCGEIDVAVLVDGALSYLYPNDVELPERILSQAAAALRSGGKVILEFDVLSPERVSAMEREGAFRVWFEGDEKDAFRYALYETRILDWDQMVVENRSTYLHRTTSEERVKREIYKYYGRDELAKMLTRLGFNPEFFGSFNGDAYGPCSSSLIVVATKA